jgi:hypothetical protein
MRSAQVLQGAMVMYMVEPASIRFPALKSAFCSAWVAMQFP